MNKDNIVIEAVECLLMDDRYYFTEGEKQLIAIKVTFTYNKHKFITRFGRYEFEDDTKVSHEEIKDKIVEVINS